MKRKPANPDDGFTVVAQLPGAGVGVGAGLRARLPARVATRRTRDWRDGLPLLEVTLTPEAARRLGLRVRCGEPTAARLLALGYDLPAEVPGVAPHLATVLERLPLPEGYTVGSVDRCLYDRGRRCVAVTYPRSKRILVSELATPEEQAEALRAALGKLGVDVATRERPANDWREAMTELTQACEGQDPELLRCLAARIRERRSDPAPPLRLADYSRPD